MEKFLKKKMQEKTFSKKLFQHKLGLKKIAAF